MTVELEALGSYVHLATRAAGNEAEALAIARRVLDDVDRTCSRFRADSDLSRANAEPGHWVRVDPLLATAVAVAVDVARDTDGLVHPLLGRPLVQWGYDRTFRAVGEPVPLPITTPPLESWRDLLVDPEGAVRVPADTALDLGATGKALAADLVADAWAAAGVGPAIVSLGGDVAVSDPDGRPWPVAVGTRRHGPVTQGVLLASGGLATSSTRVRRWRAGGVERHHVLDPRTGAPADTPWTTVTATGPGAVAANAATTAALVLGEAAPDWLAARGVDALLLRDDGTELRVCSWPTPDGARRSA